MTDEMIERCAEAYETVHHVIAEPAATSAIPRIWITEGSREAGIRAALSALKPGDVLPNGCVVVPDNDWAVVAQFSALSPAKKRAVFAFIDAAKEEG